MAKQQYGGNAPPRAPDPAPKPAPISQLIHQSLIDIERRLLGLEQRLGALEEAHKASLGASTAPASPKAPDGLKNGPDKAS